MKPTKACLVRRTWKPFYAMAKCASEMSISELIEARENVGRFLGPLMDRIDIQVDVPAVPYKDLTGARVAESSETIRHRVVAARNTQLRRFFDEHIYSNAQMGPRHIRKFCVLTAECEKILENAVTKLGFSARGYDRILKKSQSTRGTTSLLSL